MRRYSFPSERPDQKIAFILAVSGTLLSLSPVDAFAMPQGAFLLHPVTTVQSLTKQIDENRVVRYRYARTFNMSPTSVRAAFAQLKPHRLTEDHIFEVHYVRDGEKVGYKLRRVRKGTWVYAMPDGTPALAQVCGNPLRKSLVVGRTVSHPQIGMPPVPNFSPTESLMPVVTIVSPTLSAMETVALPSEMSSSLVPPPALGFVESPNIVPVASLPAPSNLPRPLLYRVANTQLGQWLHHGSTFPFGLAALGLPFLGLSSGGSAPHFIPPVVIIPGTPAPAVPESSPAMMLAAGSIAFIMMWRRNFKRRR